MPFTGTQKEWHRKLPFYRNPKKYEEQLKYFYAELEASGIKVFFFYRKSKMDFLKIAARLAKQLKANHYEALHATNFNSDLIAVLTKKLFYRRLKLLSTKQGYQEDQLLSFERDHKAIKKNIYYFISKWSIKNTDHLVAASHAIANFYAQCGLAPFKMTVIHHGIQQIPPINEKLILEGDPKIISVGRLVGFKGHIYLIRAIPYLIKKYPKMKLVIVGDGPLKDSLQAEAKILDVSEHIEFTGFAAPALYIPHCQVMVIPSLFEAFGFVYIEAFAMRIPLIAFNTGAASEIIENNVDGILVSRENSGELAQKILFLLESPQQRERFAENGYKKFLTHFSVERMAYETAEWYRSVL